MAGTYQLLYDLGSIAISLMTIPRSCIKPGTVLVLRPVLLLTAGRGFGWGARAWA